MKRKIHIELFESHDCVNFYTIRFDEEITSETDKFFDKYENSKKHKKDFDVIATYLDIIGEEGASTEYLRREGGKLKALPIEASILRLYCYRFSDCIVILGNGGEKNTRTYQEDLYLNQCVSDLRNTGHLMEHLIKNEKISVYQCKLYGNLELYINKN